MALDTPAIFEGAIEHGGVISGDSGFSTGGAGLWTMLRSSSKTCSISPLVRATPPHSYKRIMLHGLRLSRAEISTLRCGTPTKAFNAMMKSAIPHFSPGWVIMTRRFVVTSFEREPLPCLVKPSEPLNTAITRSNSRGSSPIHFPRVGTGLRLRPRAGVA